MFKFNFSTENQLDTEGRSLEKDNLSDAIKWKDSVEVFPSSGNEIIMKDIYTNSEVNNYDFNGISLKYFSTVDILNILRTNDECETATFSVLNADQDHSDLQAAVYEGGLKIWECTYDLITYLLEHDLPLKGKNVLDLGCGAGLIGILCLQKGSLCTFQDYNDEVLQYITISNVCLNDEKYVNDSTFYSGDWQSFINLRKENNKEKFDYIFTSETIYNTENYDKLHNVFMEALKKDGEIYLAAKSYYFGVGGGISSFDKFLKSKGIFKATSCWDCSQGVKREILRIQFI